MEKHRAVISRHLNGSDKRKLQISIALLGAPKIVLLDEPSTGMDPDARRFMKSVIDELTSPNKKTTVILTTNSCQEAEALSTKMGIMAQSGVLSCFGSPQHVQNKFATGFEIEIKIRLPSQS